MPQWDTRFPVKSTVAAALRPGQVIVAVWVVIVVSSIHNVDSQTQHYSMRRPICNSFFRDVPAALLEGAGGYRMGPGICDITLTAPDFSAWMLKIERAVILDCKVLIQVYDTYLSPLNGKPLHVHGCATPDPGIIYINSSTLTVRLRHNNSSDYSFTIVVTAKKIVSNPNASCSGFRCQSGACVEKTLVCDAVDNCFDYSDESSNETMRCDAGFWPFHKENWGVLASVVGAGLVLGVTAACCRHFRNKRRLSLDDLYELNEGPYVHKYAYRYAMIRPPKKPNQTNVVLGRDGHMHYKATNV